MWHCIHMYILPVFYVCKAHAIEISEGKIMLEPKILLQKWECG